MNRSKRDIPALQPGSNQVVSVDRFLSTTVCREFVDAANRAYWSRSEVELPSDRLGEPVPASSGRYSSTLMATDLGSAALQELKKLERSLNASFGIEPANLEPWQLTRYVSGDAFDYHLDCGAWKNEPCGERRRSILIYLQRPACGGSTHFRALNLTVHPLEGRLVLWSNLLPNKNSNYAMIHAARPVWQGCKVVLTTWEHEGRYTSH